MFWDDPAPSGTARVKISTAWTRSGPFAGPLADRGRAAHRRDRHHHLRARLRHRLDAVLARGASRQGRAPDAVLGPAPRGLAGRRRPCQPDRRGAGVTDFPSPSPSTARPMPRDRSRRHKPCARSTGASRRSPIRRSSSPCGPRPRWPRRPRPCRGPAPRHPGRREGQHRRGGPAHHLRLPRLRARRDRGCRPGGAPAPGRGARHRQDQPRPVRHRPRRRALALRRAAQHPRSGPGARRLVVGLGGRGGGRAGAAGARHRHRRLRPGAGRAQRHRRAQASLGALSTTRGVVPACRTLDCVSIFALTAEDAFAGFSALAGFDAADPFSRALPVGDPARCRSESACRTARAGVLPATPSRRPPSMRRSPISRRSAPPWSRST